MSIEERLRAALQRRAASVEPRPDLEDVDHRAAHGGRRHARALVAALALVLVAGPVAGFAIGRATSSESDGDQPSVRADGTADGATEAVPGGFGGGVPIPGPIGPGYFPGDPFGPPLERLFVRTTDDDVAIRAYRANYGPDAGCPPGAEGCPPPQCFPVGQISGELSDELSVGWAYGEIFSESDPALAVQAGYSGVAEGSPTAWAVVQVGADVASVRAVLDGAEDEMEPVQGVAVLAAHVPAPPTAGGVEDDSGPVPLAAYAPGGVIEALDADGSVIASRDLSEPYRPPYDTAECLPPPPPPPPPPTLPEPNGPPPADEEAARAAITDAFAALYNDALPDEEQFAGVEGGPEFGAPLWDQAKENVPGSPEAASVVVKEVRFLNETEAAVVYDILLNDYPSFQSRLGSAKLVDGRWIVGRDGFCTDLELASVTCPPP